MLRCLFPLARHYGRPFLFCSEQPLNFDVPSNKPIKENPMIRVPSLLFAAVLMTSASAFAADTPDPNQKGEPILPSGSNEGNSDCPEVH